jgi:hypothetical protein
MDEVHRTIESMTTRKGIPLIEAAARASSCVQTMNRAFPAASIDRVEWWPLMKQCENDEKDRHVMAVGMAMDATTIVTINIDDFNPVPEGSALVIQQPDDFLLEHLDASPAQVTAAVMTMASRHRRPPHTAHELAQFMANGQFIPRFGRAMLDVLEVQRKAGEQQRALLGTMLDRLDAQFGPIDEALIDKYRDLLS